MTALKELPDNSVDSVVTDPPYGLSFMGKHWDYDVPSVDLWKEVLRVLKPGGFLLSFAGTRTYHRMAVNIEDAGFEIRDMISWLYGSGFPKSLNIGKQIDKIQGNDREDLGEYDTRSKYDNCERKSIGDVSKTIYKAGIKDTKSQLTKGNSDWEGWGTALKPACEPIVVARKPLSEKNVASNCLKWGTGGINIDGCRIDLNGDKKIGGFGSAKSGYQNGEFGDNGNEDYKCKWKENTQGRFPANIILDEEAGKILDEQTFGKVGNGHWSQTKVTGFGEFGNGKSEYFGVGEKDKEKGGASRFFYCAKAGKKERNLGCEELEEIESVFPGANTFDEYGNRIRKDGSIIPPLKSKNNHPTVKPIKLMQYLVKLVTKNGGVCLDPFLGSGTTAMACIKEGMNYIGIELEEEYIKIANARIKAVEDTLV